MFEKYIENKKDEMINTLQSLIQIPSTFKISKDPEKPFGEKTQEALDFVLSVGKQLGFRTKNIDGYCGYLEFGEGKELLGIIGHLDVVPEGENWTYPPFSGKIVEGKIYGRGAIDDKGPVIASLYAMKAVMDTCQLHKRVRLILGLNEEKDWKCINYYKQKEEIPTLGFSPDADFPCIYAEKSILTEYLSMNYAPYQKEAITIQELDCHQNAINVVPKFASVILKIDSSKISMNHFIKIIQTILKKYSFEIDLYKMNDEMLKLTAYGLQAHAAHPDLGINAISRLLIILQEIFSYYEISLPILEFFTQFVGEEYDGNSLGITCFDESGKLTLNVGNFALISTSTTSVLEIGMNVRIPVHTLPTIIAEKINKLTLFYPHLTAETKKIQDALYLSPENNLVKTLCKIYNRVTHSEENPIAIGGATYARAFPNCVSFGANLPSQKDMCHQTDEFISIDNLLLASKIYAEAIYELAQ